MAHLKYVCIRFHDPPTEEELRREHLNRELSADNSMIPCCQPKRKRRQSHERNLHQTAVR